MFEVLSLPMTLFFVSVSLVMIAFFLFARGNRDASKNTLLLAAIAMLFFTSNTPPPWGKIPITITIGYMFSIAMLALAAYMHGIFERCSAENVKT